MTADKIILGIDPGTAVTGYGMIHHEGKKLKLLTWGVIHLEALGDDHPAKLKRIFQRTLSLIDEFHPDELAIEAPFFGKNVQSMLKLGRAQGVCIAAAMVRDLPIYEYAPRKIKKAVTGLGNASKEQVAGMLEQIFPEIKQQSESYRLDATDALAAALCHHYQGGGMLGKSGKKFSGWADFLKENPDRVKP